MKTLARYLEVIVDPTFDDFYRDRRSVRLAYLACVVIYHSVDRAANASGTHSVIRDAVRFVHKKAGTTHPKLP